MEGGPNSYWVVGHLGTTYDELHWLLFDFCRMHQIVYKEIVHIEEQLDSVVQENKEELILSTNTESSEEEFYEELQKTRVLDGIIAKNHENRRVVGFIDQMAVKTRVDADTVSSPYRWDNFVKNYASIGIDLSICDSFQDANECRIVNNAIKHDPRVGERLEPFLYFEPYKDNKLMDVPLDMQRYLNGITNFLGSLIEKLDTQLGAKQ
jgi:hypothetical protein